METGSCGQSHIQCCMSREEIYYHSLSLFQKFASAALYLRGTDRITLYLFSWDLLEILIQVEKPKAAQRL